MKLGFYGAAHEVTGSCTLIEVGEKKGIVDFGMEKTCSSTVRCRFPRRISTLSF